MIQPDFQNFFLAVAGASAALIGLLFVAVSVTPEQVVGPKALALHEVRAMMALTAFASTLVLSLIALMPHAHVAWPATVVGAVGTIFFIRSLRRLRSVDDQAKRHALVLLLSFLLLMLYLISSGIRSLIAPDNTNPVVNVGIAAIALIALGIDRSWELVGGRTTGLTGLLTNRINGHADARTAHSTLADMATEETPRIGSERASPHPLPGPS